MSITTQSQIEFLGPVADLEKCLDKTLNNHRQIEHYQRCLFHSPRLPCLPYYIWILLRVILHDSWNMQFSIHQYYWAKPLLYRRLSHPPRPWRIGMHPLPFAHEGTWGQPCALCYHYITRSFLHGRFPNSSKFKKKI